MKYYIFYQTENTGVKVFSPNEEVPELLENGYKEVTEDEFNRVISSTKLTSSELREEAYNTEQIISWDGSMITVTEASQLWQYYAAEGNSKANQLQTLISEAKATIRAKYPD